MTCVSEIVGLEYLLSQTCHEAKTAVRNDISVLLDDVSNQQWTPWKIMLVPDDSNKKKQVGVFADPGMVLCVHGGWIPPSIQHCCMTDKADMQLVVPIEVYVPRYYPEHCPIVSLRSQAHLFEGSYHFIYTAQKQISNKLPRIPEAVASVRRSLTAAPSGLIFGQFCTAVKDNNIDVIHQLLPMRFDPLRVNPYIEKCSDQCVNFFDYDGKTALHIAVELDRIDIIPLLLEHGGRLAPKWVAKPDVVASLFSGFLHKAWQVQINLMHDVLCTSDAFTKGSYINGVVAAATEVGTHEVINMLQEAGFAIPPSVLAVVTNHNNSSLVAFLSENADVDVNWSSPSSLAPSALLTAVQINNITMVQTLLFAGADLYSIKQPSRYSVLHEARSAEMVRVLVAAGADLECRDQFGNTPLLTATVDRLPCTVTALLQAGANCDARNNNGDTALLLAIELNKTDNMRLLVRAGASPEVQNRTGNNALHLAQRKRADYLRCCIQECGCPDAAVKLSEAMRGVNTAGETPLLLAMHDIAYLETFHLLLSIADPDTVNIPDRNGSTALHLALYRDNVLELSLAAGANVYATDGKGRTVLHLSVKEASDRFHSAGWIRYRRFFPLLLQAGNNLPNFVNQQDNQGQTALLLAVRYSLIEIVQQLLAAGADPTIADNAGKTALDYARDSMIRKALLNSSR